ncbi:hypothetical protein [Nonomuraea lactucae]|uniref:hypothetical protein n=1 Tax=Nonomuraea lactucae TaxID=2249762 RepID=UPI000DE34E88|nr:hypothetical protein [Nonomuraea lactucae]
MSSLRKTPSGRWQATVRVGRARRSRTFPSRREARRWADNTEVAARRLAHAAPTATFTWTAAGLSIHIPENLITMDRAMVLERLLIEVLAGAED